MKKDLLTEINKRLKAGATGVRIEQQKGRTRLYLVATLPPKPGSVRQLPHQQRISLGLYANPAGIKKAEVEARRLSALIATKEFNWNRYISPGLKHDTVADWVKGFEINYFNYRERTPKTESTWESNYLTIFKRLPENKPLTAQLLINAVLSTPPDTHFRRSFCLALGALARFTGIPLDLKKLSGKYSAKRVSARNLPSDEEIIDWYYQIPNPAWQYVYGLLAAFGLRNHEVFFVDLNYLHKTGICHVTEGKTGSGKVWALYPEWVDLFDLKSAYLPNCHGLRHLDYGNRVCKAFSRYKIPFTAYDLRHCWARRSVELGLDPRLAAKQMRHSLKTHSETYNLWLTDDQHQKAHDAIIKRLKGDR